MRPWRRLCVTLARAIARPRHAGLATAAALIAAFVAVGCASATNSLHPGREAVRSVDVPGVGRALVDDSGKTLYMFLADARNDSSCYGACASVWPPVLTSGKPAAEHGVLADKLSTYRRDDGGTQVTYNGHPLYYYQADAGAGDAYGQAVNQFGAEWYAITPAGQVAEKGSGS
jgi:predicted lipoprotein with Yx(FWY)xxD motif